MDVSSASNLREKVKIEMDVKPEHSGGKGGWGGRKNKM